MIDTGEYRTDIPSLSAITIREYERIFKIFKSSIDDKDFFVYNTLKTIEFPTIDSQYLGQYEAATNLPMTILSYNIYGDINSWWIIYLMNKDLFEGAPFMIDGGTQVQYILPELRSSIYSDITNDTVFGGRHF